LPTDFRARSGTIEGLAALGRQVASEANLVEVGSRLARMSHNFSVASSKGPGGVLTTTDQWKELETHFRHHASLVRRFRRANADLVLRMWQTSRNEFGKPLSSYEREALIERHCELFGTWPT
jgi:hypothetical protein